jgi:methylmalonyl-CoA/ethylmalonyl-CoA epimerase
MSVAALGQVAIHCEDLERARAFYERLLGQEAAAVFDPPGLVFFRLGASRLLLDQAAPSSLIYLEVDDVAVEVERLRGEGVEVLSEAHVIYRHDDDRLGHEGTEEWMAFVRDSEDNMVGLVSHRAI